MIGVGTQEACVDQRYAELGGWMVTESRLVHCGDMMFSGHTFSFTIAVIMIRRVLLLDFAPKLYASPTLTALTRHIPTSTVHVKVPSTTVTKTITTTPTSTTTTDMSTAASALHSSPAHSALNLSEFPTDAIVITTDKDYSSSSSSSSLSLASAVTQPSSSSSTSAVCTRSDSRSKLTPSSSTDLSSSDRSAATMTPFATYSEPLHDQLPFQQHHVSCEHELHHHHTLYDNSPTPRPPLPSSTSSSLSSLVSPSNHASTPTMAGRKHEEMTNGELVVMQGCWCCRTCDCQHRCACAFNCVNCITHRRHVADIPHLQYFSSYHIDDDNDDDFSDDASSTSHASPSTSTSASTSSSSSSVSSSNCSSKQEQLSAVASCPLCCRRRSLNLLQTQFRNLFRSASSSSSSSSRSTITIPPLPTPTRSNTSWDKLWFGIRTLLLVWSVLFYFSIIKSRMHYSVDVLIAIFLSLLISTHHQLVLALVTHTARLYVLRRRSTSPQVLYASSASTCTRPLSSLRQPLLLQPGCCPHELTERHSYFASPFLIDERLLHKYLHLLGKQGIWP